VQPGDGPDRVLKLVLVGHWAHASRVRCIALTRSTRLLRF
jgi:hypothetical protein